MTSRELSKLVTETWNSTIPAKRLEVLDNIRRTVPPDQLELFDAFVDVAKDIGLQPEKPLIIVLIHGIRTDGAWQTKFRQSLSNVPDVHVIPVGYGFFSVLGLLGPFRGKPIASVERKIQDARNLHPGSDMVIVAHSFGTYIITKLLQSNQTFDIGRLLLCGAIVSKDFEWDRLNTKYNSKTVLNEVGTRDIYPVIANAGTWGYGATGRFGVQGPRVYDRYFNYGHSDFFHEEHFEKFWKPFVVDGVIQPSDWDTKRDSTSWIVGLLTACQGMLWLLLAPLVVLLGWALL